MNKSERLSAEEAAEWFDMIIEHFGLPTDIFEGVVLAHSNGKMLHVINSDIDPTKEPKTVSLGIPFVRINMAVPKPTTAAVFWFGGQATRNVIELGEDELDDYLRRVDRQGEGEPPYVGCHPGYVILRFRGVPMGVGYLHHKNDTWRFENMHPKAWRLGDEASAVKK